MLEGNLLSIQRPGTAAHGAAELEVLDGSAPASFDRELIVGGSVIRRSAGRSLPETTGKVEGSILQLTRHRSAAQKPHDAHPG